MPMTSATRTDDPMNMYAANIDPFLCPPALADRNVLHQLSDLPITLASAAVWAHPDRRRDAEALGLRIAEKPDSPEEQARCPNVAWCAASPAHWSWAWLLLGALNDEREHRFGAPHRSRAQLPALLELMGQSDEDRRRLRFLGLIEPPATWPRSKAGRRTLLHDFQDSARQELAWRYWQWADRGRPPKWTSRKRPAWLTEALALTGDWYLLLAIACRCWFESGGGHDEARAFLAAVHDGPEPMRWLVCINEEAVLRVDWQFALAEAADDPDGDGDNPGPVRDAATVPPRSEVRQLTVWATDRLLYKWPS